MGEGLDIGVIGDGDGLVAPLGSSGNQVFDRGQGIHGGHIGMGMKLDSLLVIRHQVLADFLFDFLHILDIHGQVARVHIGLNIASHPQPVALLNHVKLLGIFFILGPFLQLKGGGIVRHLEVDNDTASSGRFLLDFKDQAFKHQAIFFRFHFCHRSDGFFLQRGPCWLFLFKILEIPASWCRIWDRWWGHLSQLFQG